MRLLTHTNILVDDFEMCKDYKKNTFIHFLTHFHFDHWYKFVFNHQARLISFMELWSNILF